jgi:hypothetical protein
VDHLSRGRLVLGTGVGHYDLLGDLYGSTKPFACPVTSILSSQRVSWTLEFRPSLLNMLVM